MPKLSLNIIINKINKFLFVIILLELFLGGGGQLTKFGFLTLRMMLFFLALTINIPLFLITPKINKYVIELLVIFTLYLVFYFLIGFFKETSLSIIFRDIKPLIYFYSIIFFYNNIKELSDIKFIINILKISSIIMTILYILFYYLINFGLIDFPQFYHTLSISGEFFFRGEQAFFYKGFFYMCVGFIFFFNEKKVLSNFLSILIFAAIVLTFTRGFILSLILSYIMLEIFSKRFSFKTLILLVFNILIIGALFIFYNFQNIGNKATSDSVRLNTIDEVYEQTGFINTFIGNGFGKGVTSRDIHMEISYLEIFFKQGILGLFFYLYMFIFLIQFYNRAVKNGNSYYAKPLLLAAIFTYIQSFTNPFINNPIGMSMVIISLISLDMLGNSKIDNDISLYSNV